MADLCLIEATMVGDVELARVALASGADPNYSNSHGMCPLLVCCGGSGPVEMLDILIAAGARVDITVRVQYYPVREHSMDASGVLD